MPVGRHAHRAHSLVSGSRCRGSSALEILVALPIALGLSAALVSTLHRSAAGTKEARRLESRELAILKTGVHLTRLMEDLDRHRFALSPRVHRNGIVTTANGAPLILSRNARLAPGPGSDAISGIRLSLERTHDVETWAGGETISARACPRYGTSLEGADRVAGLAPDGIFEYRVTASRPHFDCELVTLVPEEGVMLESSPSSVPGTIVPIDSEHTLYVSSSDELRFVTHSGTRNVENQPLVEGISKLRLQLSMERGLLTLGASGESGRPFEWRLPSLLARTGHLDFLFSRRQ